MNAGIQNIVTSYEILGMSPEEIASDSDMRLDVTAIKLALSHNSVQYRQDAQQRASEFVAVEMGVGETRQVDKATSPVSSLGFSDFEAQAVKSVIFDIALNDEIHPAIRLKSAIYVYDDFKGRNDVKAMADEVNRSNIFEISKAILKAKQIISKVGKPAQETLVDV